MFKCFVDLFDGDKVPLLVGCLLVLGCNYQSVSTLADCVHNLVAIVDLELLVVDLTQLPFGLVVFVRFVHLYYVFA